MLAREGIEELNEKYASARRADGDVFFLFHRPRRWNAQERLWMGYERKRGKLADLNALLRGGAAGRASRSSSATTDAAVGRASTSSRSTPTRSCRATPRGSSSARWRTRSTARVRRERRRRASCEGYGILQPRVGVEPARRQPLAVRAPVRRRARHRPVHARRLRRLPGRVRRRLVHRQGHLRRRCVRAGAERALSREPDPQPRPARRLLCARRAC